MSSVIFYSPCIAKFNGYLLFSLVLEYSPGWIIDASRKEWILEAIRARDLNFLRVLVETVERFDLTTEYIEMAARTENNQAILEYLIAREYPIHHYKTIFTTVDNRALNNLKWLAKNKFPVKNRHVCERAASTENNTPILEYLVSCHGDSIDHGSTFCSAADAGALNNMKWLLQNGFALNSSCIFDCAIINGSSKNLKWLKKNGCLLPTRLSIFPRPKFCLSIETLEWLVDQGVSLTGDSCLIALAAREGSLDKIQWLSKHGCQLVSGHSNLWWEGRHSEVFAAATDHGSLRNMKWLFENGCPIHYSEFMIQAAIQGSLRNMKWLFKNGCPVTNSAILVKAARQGNLKNMQWLLKNGCPINDSNIFRAAAEFGSIRQMEWLLKKGCPINDPYILAAAAEYGNVETMEWLLQQGCPINNSCILARAATHGSLTKMKWLFRKGCPIKHCRILRGAAKHGSLRNMKWLLENGCPINNPSILEAAVVHGSLVNMKWLFENGCPLNDSGAFSAAAENGSLVNMKWLLQNECPVDIFDVCGHQNVIYDSLQNLARIWTLTLRW